ncbi:kinase-like domain-containing protein [Daldinia bambusicola]|nr:kinase-like domain-containing protein [Daldinia bambusicola]
MQQELVTGNFDRWYPGQFTYQRTLGYGGFGLATLWKVRTQSGRILEVAIKSSLSNSGQPDNELRREINIQGDILKGAEHIVQLVEVEDNLLSDVQLYNNPHADVPVMIMEVLEKANLSDLIDRLNKARLENRRILREANIAGIEVDRSELQIGYIPNRILWRLFLCLARGITGMAYGPPNTPNYRPGDGFRETIQDRAPRPLLHMDLDIYNVLLGDITFNQQDGEHSFSPIIKIADFGIALELHPNLTPSQKAQLVQKGKRDFYAPEQRDAQSSSIDPDAVGMPINVWAIGVTMMNLLTLAHPENLTWNARVRSYPAPTHWDPDYRQRFVTWGWFLVDDEEHHPSPFIRSFDPELRLLIARCLETYGPRRPTLHELLVVIIRNIAESDAKHNALAEERIAREEEEYRQHLIAQEQRQAQAAASFYGQPDPFFQGQVPISPTPARRRPGFLNSWLAGLPSDRLPPTQPKQQQQVNNPLVKRLGPGSRTVREAPVIDLLDSDPTTVAQPPLISLPSTEDPWATMKQVPVPPGYDPDHPMYPSWPADQPTPGFQGVPSPTFAPLQPPQQQNPATRYISRNEYRPITDYQRAPELEDAELIMKFYDDHVRNPPPKVDPYEKLWMANSHRQQQAANAQIDSLRIFGPRRRGRPTRPLNRSRSPDGGRGPMRQRSRGRGPSPPSKRRRFEPRP